MPRVVGVKTLTLLGVAPEFGQHSTVGRSHEANSPKRSLVRYGQSIGIYGREFCVVISNRPVSNPWFAMRFRIA